MEYQWETVTHREIKVDDFTKLKLVSTKDSPESLYYYSETGEYVRPKKGVPRVFQVMYSPYPPILKVTGDQKLPQENGKSRLLGEYTIKLNEPLGGKRADTIFMDDVETPKDEGMKTWWGTFLTTNTNKTEPTQLTYKNLMDTYNKLYEKRVKEVYSEFEKMILYGTGPRKSIWEKKEKKMEIGGHNCHLCGAEILQENRDTVYKKKQHLRVVNRYQCGTIVEKSWKSRGDGYVVENHSQKVILGDDCVEI